jgi:pathogenesis-related protein 1
MARWLGPMIVVLTACGSGAEQASDAAGAPSDGAPSGTPGEPAELAGITLAHNQVRAMVATATALPPLVWDDALAATAAAYVRRCRDDDGDGLVDHNEDRSAGHPFYVGENIYASTGAARAAAAVTAWAGEVAHYHAADNTCDADEACGHYTQIVWRATQKVGCAVFACAGLRFPSTIVCDYGPGGNVRGQRPY